MGSGGNGRWCCVRWWRWWGWWRWRWLSTIPFGILLFIFFVLWASFSMWRFRTLSNHSGVPLFIEDFNYLSQSIERFIELFLFWRGTFMLSFSRHNGYGFRLRNSYWLYLFNHFSLLCNLCLLYLNWWRWILRWFRCFLEWSFGWGWCFLNLIPSCPNPRTSY